MQQVQTIWQSGVTASQSEAQTQMDGPGEVIVNEQEQDKEVNEQDETFEANEKERAYSEGNMNNSDTEVKPAGQTEKIEDLPGTQPDPEKAATGSEDVV